MANEALLTELKTLLIEGLHLEEVEIEDIGDNEPLFGEGLGLDSIDALEIAVLLDRNYGIKISSGDDRNETIFTSIGALTEFVAENRTN